jgi:membrane-associated phospholipid phosphatase
MMRGGAIGNGRTGNCDPARRRRCYPLNLHAVASMPVEWVIILVVAVSDGLLLTKTSFRLETSPELRIVFVWILVAVVFVVCRWRRFPRLAHLARTWLTLSLFTNAVLILSFILTGILPLPLWDEALATADCALRLDWLDMYQWVTRYPAIEASAHAVYMSLAPEMLILLIALELLGRHNEASAFLRWIIVSGIATICIGALIPAAGAFVYYHLPVASTTGYVSQFADLRDGTLRTISPFDNRGLVAFPSYHAALAVLCACAARPLRIVKIPLLAFNLLIILSSPAMGGHYFIDIIAGITLAALTISLPSYNLSAIWRLKKNIRHGDAPVFASK